jgi:hypothetical protein
MDTDSLSRKVPNKKYCFNMFQRGVDIQNLFQRLAGNYNHHKQFPKCEYQTKNVDIVQYLSFIVMNTTIDNYQPHECTQKMETNV